MAKHSNSIQLDSYKTRASREKKLYKSEFLFENNMFSYIATILFVLCDACCLYTAFNYLMTENPLMLIFMVGASAFVLDVPPAIAGRQLKAYHQGITSKKTVFYTIISAVLCVVLVMIFYFIMKILTRNIVFTIDVSDVLNNSVVGVGTETDTSDSDKTILFASLFQAVLPIGTSIASFLFSFISDPLKDKAHKLKLAKITAQANQIDLDVAIAEAEDENSYCKYLIARENDNYRNFIGSINTQSLIEKNIAALVVMEKLGSAESISSITESAEKLNSDNQLSDDVEQESLNCIFDYYSA